MQHLQNIDERPKPERMRQRELVALAKKNGLPYTVEDGTEMTKDMLLVTLQARSYQPRTFPLGQSPETAGYEVWEIHGLRAEAKKRGIAAGHTWSKQDFINALETADAELHSFTSPFATEIPTVEEPVTEPPGYAAWMMGDLRAEAKVREITADKEWKKEDYVAALVASDLGGSGEYTTPKAGSYPTTKGGRDQL